MVAKYSVGWRSDSLVQNFQGAFSGFQGCFKIVAFLFFCGTCWICLGFICSSPGLWGTTWRTSALSLRTSALLFSVLHFGVSNLSNVSMRLGYVCKSHLAKFDPSNFVVCSRGRRSGSYCDLRFRKPLSLATSDRVSSSWFIHCFVALTSELFPHSRFERRVSMSW